MKNANGSNFDTPDSARLLVLRLHTRWVVAAGGFLTHSVPLYATGKLFIFITKNRRKYNFGAGALTQKDIYIHGGSVTEFIFS